MSLVEVMVGLGISTVVLAGSITLMTIVNGADGDYQLQSLVNQLYYQGALIVQTPRLFVDRIPTHPNPLGLSPAQLSCLGAKGTGCRAYDGRGLSGQPGTPVPAVVDPTLNQSFNAAGVCVATDPACKVTRTTNWRMVCGSDESCGGLRFDLTAHVITHGPGASTKIRDRTGLIFIPARQFVAKQNVTFQCASSGNKMVFSIDYLNRVDRCSTFDAGPGCPRPMNTFASPDNCERNQSKPCANGFKTIGYFESQEVCI